MPSKNTAIIILVLCLLASLGACLGVYFTNVACGWGLGTWVGSDCPKDEDEAVISSSVPAPAPAPAAVQFPSGSIKLLNSETTFNGNNGDTPVANTPANISASADVKYTISFKIKPTADGTGWREILQNYEGSSWTNNALDARGNAPLFSIFPASEGAAKNKLLFRHTTTSTAAAAGNWPEVQTPQPLSLTDFTTVTCTANVNTLTMYINGVPTSPVILQGTEKLTYKDTNRFIWNPNSYPTITPFVVKDAYWWSRVLTADEITYMGTYTAPSGTSTYVPEPYTK